MDFFTGTAGSCRFTSGSGWTLPKFAKAECT